jgi:hypothetical protein
MATTGEPNEMSLDLTSCPDCGALAQVTERAVLDSTAGPVEHVRVVCLSRHWFLLPASSLTSGSAAGRPARSTARSTSRADPR